jgi:hypothetical protein
MNISRKSIVTVLAAATLAFGAGTASAGKGGGWGGGWGDCGGGGFYGKADGKWNEKDFKERIAERQERLKKALAITSKQEAAWKTFTDQMTAQMQERFKNFDPDQFLGLTTPERMEKQLAFSRQAQGTMEKRLEAVKTFYNSLTPEQKKKFDDWHSSKRR